MKIEKTYVCTNCGYAIDDLYRQFGGIALKLTKCVNLFNEDIYNFHSLFLQEKCNSIADKYVEYDLVNVIIDLILLKIVAIRHFLFNSTYKVARISINYFLYEICFVEILETHTYIALT